MILVLAGNREQARHLAYQRTSSIPLPPDVRIATNWSDVQGYGGCRVILTGTWREQDWVHEAIDYLLSHGCTIREVQA